MANRSQKLNDLFEISKIMEEKVDIDANTDSITLEDLQLLWDHEPTSPIVVNLHSFVKVDEIDEFKDDKLTFRAFVYECTKCGSRVVVPASESGIGACGTLTCDEKVISEVME